MNFTTFRRFLQYTQYHTVVLTFTDILHLGTNGGQAHMRISSAELIEEGKEPTEDRTMGTILRYVAPCDSTKTRAGAS